MKFEHIIAGVIGLLFLFGTIAFVWFAAAMEASTYRKLTGKQVTTWDALWVDLRVQEGVQP